MGNNAKATNVSNYTRGFLRDRKSTDANFRHTLWLPEDEVSPVNATARNFGTKREVEYSKRGHFHISPSFYGNFSVLR